MLMHSEDKAWSKQAHDSAKPQWNNHCMRGSIAVPGNRNPNGTNFLVIRG
jgi:hypothetical protein